MSSSDWNSSSPPVSHLPQQPLRGDDCVLTSDNDLLGDDKVEMVSREMQLLLAQVLADVHALVTAGTGGMTLPITLTCIFLDNPSVKLPYCYQDVVSHIEKKRSVFLTNNIVHNSATLLFIFLGRLSTLQRSMAESAFTFSLHIKISLQPYYATFLQVLQLK